MTKKLNFGVGYDYRDGWVNMDFDPETKADVIHDFNKLPLPFPDNHFDEIRATHILEHILYPYETFLELVRILKPHGKMTISSPNPCNILGRLDFLKTGNFDRFKTYGRPEHWSKVNINQMHDLYIEHLKPIKFIFITLNGNLYNQIPILPKFLAKNFPNSFARDLTAVLIKDPNYNWEDYNADLIEVEVIDTKETDIVGYGYNSKRIAKGEDHILRQDKFMIQTEEDFRKERAKLKDVNLINKV